MLTDDRQRLLYPLLRMRARGIASHLVWIYMEMRRMLITIGGCGVIVVAISGASHGVRRKTKELNVDLFRITKNEYRFTK